MDTHRRSARYDDDRMPRLVDVNTTAKVLGISRSQVYVLVKTGKLSPVRVGARLRFRLDELERGTR